MCLHSQSRCNREFLNVFVYVLTLTKCTMYRQFNFLFVSPMKLLKKLPSEVRYFSKIEEIFTYCPDFLNSPKLKICDGNWAEEISVLSTLCLLVWSNSLLRHPLQIDQIHYILLGDNQLLCKADLI